MSIAGQHDHPAVKDAYATMIAACHRHGKVPGIGGVDFELAAIYIRMGARLVLSGVDFGFMMQGAAARSSFLRALETEPA